MTTTRAQASVIGHTMAGPKRSLSDYRVGEVLNSARRTITEADLVFWSALIGDWTPLHTDAEYAKTTQFGQRIAHGNIALTVSSGLLLQQGASLYLPASFVRLLGWEQVRFTAPVLIGDTIHCRVQVVSIEDRDSTDGVLTYELKVWNQRDELVLIALQRLLVGLEDAGGSL